MFNECDNGEDIIQQNVDIIIPPICVLSCISDHDLGPIYQT